MSQTRRISGVVAAVGIVSLCALQSFNDMRRCGGPPPVVEHKPLADFLWTEADWSHVYDLTPMTYVDVYHERGVLILSLSPALANAVLGAMPRRGSSGRFCTSQLQFDELNREVGLTRISPYHRGVNADGGLAEADSSLFSISFDPELDLSAVREGYESLEHVTYADYRTYQRARDRRTSDSLSPAVRAQCEAMQTDLSMVRQRLTAYGDALGRLDAAQRSLTRDALVRNVFTVLDGSNIPLGQVDAIDGGKVGLFDLDVLRTLAGGDDIVKVPMTTLVLAVGLGAIPAASDWATFSETYSNDKNSHSTLRVHLEETRSQLEKARWKLTAERARRLLSMPTNCDDRSIWDL